MKTIQNTGLEQVQAVYSGMQTMAAEMSFMQQLAHAGKIAQGLFVARKRQ